MTHEERLKQRQETAELRVAIEKLKTLVVKQEAEITRLKEKLEAAESDRDHALQALEEFQEAAEDLAREIELYPED